MSESAANQLNRIVQLVAELSRREREGDGFVAIRALADQFDVTPAQIERDVRALAAVNDHPDHSWLSSLLVLQEGDAIALQSRGHFRRPVRLTPDEAAAIQIALAMDGEGGQLSEDLAALLREGAAAADVWHATGADRGGATWIADLASRAARERRCLALKYAGSDGRVTDRVVEVYRLVEWEGRCYLIAWCRRTGARRHFRADRVLSADLLNETFVVRAEMEAADTPGGVYRPSDEPADLVRVRFSASVARWLLERHPEAQQEPGGSVVVAFEVSDVRWLVRTVLQYGAEAEVLDPPAYREAVRRAVA
ncbi:MAG TPA: WYL domain-containing protein [Gemmatimonadales bacterium]|nr:WYL domain-containing protein [Gemmatimonadales bacterium]